MPPGTGHLQRPGGSERMELEHAGLELGMAHVEDEAAGQQAWA